MNLCRYNNMRLNRRLNKIKSFAQAFSTPALLVKVACSFQRQSLWWVLRAKPLTCLSLLSANFVRTLITNVDNKRKLSGGLRPPL